MQILIAPDKFKGSLSAMEVCLAIEEGLQQNENKFKIQHHPMADGGDGSLEVIDKHLKLTKQLSTSTDPLGRPLNTFYFSSSNTAFIELAKASGLVLLKKEERNPLDTTTFGTGQMIAQAIAKGIKNIYLFLGGSATNDGGMGIAAALGIQFFDHNQTLLEPCGENLSKVESIKVSPSFDIESIKFTLLCDVNNPLFGPNGAAHIYAKQKGADEKMIQSLDHGLKHFNKKLFKQTGVDTAELPGSGAAGGIAAALVSIFNANIKSGIDSFAELTDLETQIQQADIVISGEGRLDAQSLQGKVIDGVARLCKKHGKPFILFVGKNDLSKQEQTELGAAEIYAVMDHASGLEDGMKNGAGYLRKLGLKCGKAFFES